MYISSVDNVLALIREYFYEIGVKDDIENVFSTANFVSALVLNLPAVCLVPRNKPATSNSKQTHIHVTGEGRLFFFSRKEVDQALISSDDYCQKLLVSLTNIAALSGHNVMGQPLGFQNTTTTVKLACRNGQDTQVQISKLRFDGRDFIHLREVLYVNDLLVFLRRYDSDELITIGIPETFHRSRYSLPADAYFCQRGNYEKTFSRMLPQKIQQQNSISVQNFAPQISVPQVVIGSIVVHKMYGEGSVVNMDGNGHIKILFTVGEKTFSFPDCFSMGYVKLK